MKEIYAVLDIGSAVAKLVIGEKVNTGLNILFTKKSASRGIRHSQVSDVEAVSGVINELIEAANEELGTRITAVGLVIPTTHAKVIKGAGITQVDNEDGKISLDDVVRVLRLSNRMEIERDEAIVSTIPIRFEVDGRIVESIPVGIPGETLKVDSLIVTSKKDMFYGYLNAVEKAGLELLDVTIDSYVSAKETFDDAYLQEGAILIDIGYRSSSVAFFERGYLTYIDRAIIGGGDITKAIANAWHIPEERAEYYKIKYGDCLIDDDEDVIYTAKVDGVDHDFTKKELAEVINGAVRSLLAQIKTKIDVINDGRQYEIVIVGGCNELTHLEQVAAEILESPVRCYRPETIGAREGSFVACLGMMYYLHDRRLLIGEDNVSLVLPKGSHNLSAKFKGLTKAKEERGDSKILKVAEMAEKFFSEE